MEGRTDIYDLGEVDHLSLPGERKQKATSETQKPPSVKAAYSPRRVDFGPLPEIHADPDWTAIPSLIVPGASHLLRGDIARSLVLMTWTGLTVSLAWAIHGTLDSLAPTLGFLGIPPEAAVWTLGFLALLLGCMHVAGVYSGAQPSERPAGITGIHPVVAGIASGIVPGLGQLLNGDRVRAAVLLSGVWIAAASWVLASPWITALLAAQKLALPEWMAVACSPAFRWTMPAVLWTLGIYDAVTRAGKSS